MPYKRENTEFWWISYQDASGKRVRRSAETTSYADAKALENQLRAEHYAARKRGDSSVGFAEIMVEYLEYHAHKRSAGRDIGITTQLRRFFTGHDMTQLKPTHIRDYISARRQEGRSDGTIGRELALLSAAINYYASEHSVMLPNPVRGRKPKQGEGRVRWLTREEADRLIECARSRWPYLADFIILALHTGCRKQELLGLEWSRVNLGERLIFLEGCQTKSGKRRAIPINDSARAVLASRWNLVSQSRETKRYVFDNGQGGRWVDLKKSFRAACRMACIENFRIHDLRHTCAAWLVSSGAPLSAVRDLLGHSSVTVTEIYAHLAPGAVMDAVRKLDSGHSLVTVGDRWWAVRDSNAGPSH